MDDICWQIYAQFEREVKEILYTITFDKYQRNVYSPRIAELIVRIGMQIESISQRIYIRETSKEKKINYRTCINYFEKKWRISKKGIAIKDNVVKVNDSTRIYLRPYKDDCYKESLVGDKKLYCCKDSPNAFKEDVSEEDRCRAYRWENAYNNLKHNFYGAIKQYGTLINLIEILSALYVLNIYWDPSYIIPKLEVFGEGNNNRSDKSDIFFVFFLECYIDNEKIIVDMPDLGKKVDYDWFVFLDIRSLDALKSMEEKYLDNDWEFVLDGEKYKIPEYISNAQKRTNPFKQYHYTIRNQIAKVDLRLYEK